MTEAVDLAVGAIFSEGCQDFGLGVCNVPTWPFGIKISRTLLTDTFRAVHYLPAGFFVFTDI